MTHLDKLKELLSTGDPASINQAKDLADAVFSKGSKELNEFYSTLNDVLHDISSSILQDERQSLVWVENIDHEGEDTQIGIPVYTDIVLIPSKRGFALKVHLVWDDFDRELSIQKEPWYDETGDLDRYIPSMERALDKIFPLSKEEELQLGGGLSRKAESYHEDLLKDAQLQVERAILKILR